MPVDEQWDDSELVGKVGRYVIVRELAVEGTRTMYEAEDGEHHERVHLIVLRTDDAGQRLRAARALASVQHPGLATVRDVGKLDSGELYVATDLSPGTSLRARATGAMLDQRRALSIVCQVLEALAAAHEAGIVHGNLRPENIAVTGDGPNERVTVLELGVAMLAGATMAGDARYRAPECSEPPIDARADLYSVGAILYELLTGHPPFFGDDPEQLRRLHAYAPLQLLRQRAPGVRFVRELEELVAVVLSKHRDDRFESAAAMIQALDTARTAVEVAAAASAPPKLPPPPTDDSLLLLAQELMPPEPSRDSLPTVPVNLDRTVRPLPWWMRAQKSLRRTTRRQRWAIGASGFAVVLIAVVWSMRGTSSSSEALAPRARALLDHAQPRQAIELIDGELSVAPDFAAATGVLGDARLAIGQPREAVASYQTALLWPWRPAPGRDVIEHLGQIVDTGDAQTSDAAIALLAFAVGPPGYDTLVVRASTSPNADVRHRTFAVAEGLGVGGKIDRVASWTLDLKAAATCDQRRAIVAKLAATRDPRAQAAIRQGKVHKCDPPPVATTAPVPHKTAKTTVASKSRRRRK